MIATEFATHRIETARHRTQWIEAGPTGGPLMILVHGWPELSIVWRSQLDHFATAGWRCVAPDMRGYGGSSAPTATNSYEIREIVTDMIELHDALSGTPAIWIGHDWGSPVISSMASRNANRCRAMVNICVPYLPKGFALPNLLQLVDRDLYPIDKYPMGQWDYFKFYQESFDQAAADYEADIAATVAGIFRPGSPETVGKPSPTASVRARGGRFGQARRAPADPRDESMLSQTDYDAIVAALSKNGFSGPDSYYMNDAANIAYAAQAPNDGRLTLPVLFIHAAYDPVCTTTHSELAEPMRASCSDLSEAVIDGGHWLMQERPAEVNTAIDQWLAAKEL